MVHERHFPQQQQQQRQLFLVYSRDGNDGDGNDGGWSDAPTNVSKIGAVCHFFHVTQSSTCTIDNIFWRMKL